MKSFSKNIKYYLILLAIIFSVLIYSSYNDNRIEKLTNNSNQICVIYNYYEKNEDYKENFVYFLENGILDDVDYYIIVNGESSVNIPQKDNMFVFFRENEGYDFGAYSYIVNNKLTKPYTYYFFINTSIKGPYLKNNSKKWYEYFTKLFVGNVHVVGTTINICSNHNAACIYKNNTKNVSPHVQSMFFAIDYQYFQELVNEDFFNEDKIIKMSFNDVIGEKEVGLSQKAIEKGYNINCILPKYRGLDYINMNEDINPTSNMGDPYYKGGYFGESIDPYDVIFYKTNRM